MPGPRMIRTPWENGPTRYRVYGGAHPNGIEWETTLPVDAKPADHKKAQADMERVYEVLMSTEPKAGK